MRTRRLAPVALAALAAACARGGPAAQGPETGAFRSASPGSAADPTIRPARLVPEDVDESAAFGPEPTGGTRVLTGGLRIVTSPQGAIVAAEGRLPQAPQLTTALPERLGGGFLYVLGTAVWRSDRWLTPAAPIFTAPSTVQAVVPGLDRVYLRTSTAYLAIDGASGKLLDRGPWPTSPHVTSYAAADGWRAAAVADLRGVVATFDAGASWRTLDLAIEPRQVVASGDALAVGGLEGGRSEAWFEIRADGSTARMAGAPREAKGKMAPAAITPTARPSMPPGWPSGAPSPFPTFTTATPVPPATTTATTAPSPERDREREPRDARDGRDRQEAKDDVGLRIFGKRPIVAAIDGGWPLTDGTAVVARDGALGRVRLADGSLTEIATSAFPLAPARCQAVSLARASRPGAFGFVCGETRGPTAVYAYEPLRGRLTELKRFDRPRVVTSSGNGALAVRGGCGDDAEVSRGDVRPYCILGHDDQWREVHVRGDVVGERVVVLTDGRIAVLSPPASLDAPARLTVLDKGKATTVPIVFPRVDPSTARMLRFGVWLDGFEERRPGVLGGWLEAGGSMLGVEVALDGRATPGQFVRDAGMPFVAGRYGLGWSASRRGYETTDGGMSWKSIDLPEPLVPAAKVQRRACGPAGCLASGWVRVGWGEAPKADVPAAPPVSRTHLSISAPQVTLACEPLAGAPPVLPVVQHVAPRVAPATAPPGRTRFGGPPVLSPAGPVQGVTELPAFYSQPGPPLRDGERGLPFEVGDHASRAPRVGPLARVYTWGPKTGEWDTLGRWQVRWLSPFAGWSEARSTVPALPPTSVVDLTRVTSPFGFGGFGGTNAAFQLAAGDDPAHALLTMRRPGNRGELVLFDLEADRAPVEIRRSDGEPFGELDGVVRVAGRWYVATPPQPGASPPATTIWQVDGAVARDIARIPRVTADVVRTSTSRLARRSDGRALGFVVDGQPSSERPVAMRWVLPVDLETGALGEPESLGYEDLGGRAVEACADDTVGWVLDAPMTSATVRLRVGSASGSLHGLVGRLRLSTERACLERLAGTYDSSTPERVASLARPGARGTTTALRAGEVSVAVLAAQVRYPLRCAVTP